MKHCYYRYHRYFLSPSLLLSFNVKKFPVELFKKHSTLNKVQVQAEFMKMVPKIRYTTVQSFEFILK